MSPEAVQSILADFQNRATHLSTRGDGRETWRFGVDAHEYDLHFYPDDDTLVKRRIGGAAAAREFAQLQALQKLGIPATRVIANLKGFRLGNRKGDACIVVHDPTATPLQAFFRSASPLRERNAILAELVTRLEELHRQKLCPHPLTLDVFAMKVDRVIVADGSAKQGGLVDADRLTELDQSTRHVTSRTDRLRLWKHFRVEPPPRQEAVAKRPVAVLLREALVGHEQFGAMHLDAAEGEWQGRFLRHVPLTLPWSVASTLSFEPQHWASTLPTLLSGGGEAMKDDAAARIVAVTHTVADTSLDLIVKRPAVRNGLFARFRESRVRRMWRKTWSMLARGFACEVPLVVLERRVGGRIVEQVLIVERVPGETLANVDLNAMSPTERERLLYLSGRTLRQIEANGATHCDAKATNWIAWTDTNGHARPILIDLDGIRFYRWRGMGYERLRRAMSLHPQIADRDLANLERGYRGF